jgi:hypothetical protein
MHRVMEIFCHSLYRNAAGHLSGCMSTHAVGHNARGTDSGIYKVSSLWSCVLPMSVSPAKRMRIPLNGNEVLKVIHLFRGFNVAIIGTALSTPDYMYIHCPRR